MNQTASPKLGRYWKRKRFPLENLFVHGDSHFFRTDKPLPPLVEGMPVVPSIENLARLETFGTPNHQWVAVSADPNDPNVFSIRQRIVAANVIKRQ